MTKNITYGEATVGISGTPRKIPVIEYLQSTQKDNRVVSIMELDNDEGFIISVENPTSTGRASQNQMWLSKESFVALYGTMGLFVTGKWSVENFETLIKESTLNGENIQYSCSPNLIPNIHKVL